MSFNKFGKSGVTQ